ncbi:hypothetical protein BC567DRAFT_234335 [Phyllosticta citribraziliensis]
MWIHLAGHHFTANSAQSSANRANPTNRGPPTNASSSSNPHPPIIVNTRRTNQSIHERMATAHKQPSPRPLLHSLSQPTTHVPSLARTSATSNV